MSSSPR